MGALILDKITKKIQKNIYRARYRDNSKAMRVVPEVHVNEKSRFFYESNSRDDIVNSYKNDLRLSIDEELNTANDILENKFNFLGYPVTHRGRIHWMLDPVSEKEWDRSFSFDIVFRGEERLGDIKLPWELNKHQYFFTLGKCSWLTGNEIFSNRIMDDIDSWIADNPVYTGINWISSLEIGMRVISWIMAYPFICSKIKNEFQKRFLYSLYLQLEFIEQNLSRDIYANTHLIGEAASLIMGGIFLKTPKSGRWITKGIEILSSEIGTQVFGDGVDKEQSLNYQRFFLDYYYLISILLKINEISYPKGIDRAVEKMTEFILYSLRPDGSAPSFGDADDARGINVKKNCISDYRGLLSLGAVIFQRGDFKFGAQEISEEILWLLGTEGVRKYQQMEAYVPEQGSKAYQSGGYYIMRNGWKKDGRYLVFDCGPLGHGSSGHGHADALSFQLCSDGINYFVDPGTYSYNLDYEWRDYFRSTLAHNTVTVDGLNQSEIKDRMSWETFANAKCNHWLSTEHFDLVDGEHNGYQRLKDPVLHRRIVFFDKKEYWIIIDLLVCRGGHTFDCHLHLNPDCLLTMDHEGNSIEIASETGKKVHVDFIRGNDEDMEINLFRGDDETRLGWFSESYGVKIPAHTIRVRKKNVSNTIFVSFIRTSEKKVSLKSCSPILLTIIDQKEKTEDTLFYQSFTEKALENEEISFNGSFLFMKKRHDELLYLYANDFNKLIIKGGLDIHSRSTVKGVTLDEKKCNIDVDRDKVADLRIAGAWLTNIKVNGEEYRIGDGLIFPDNVI